MAPLQFRDREEKVLAPYPGSGYWDEPSEVPRFFAPYVIPDS
jgi:hypothetical protein